MSNSNPTYNGLSNAHGSYSIERSPMRKQLFLCKNAVVDGVYTGTPIAWFKDEAEAIAFRDWMVGLVPLERNTA